MLKSSGSPRSNACWRFAEAGVRFIQITDTGWDHHSKIRSGLPERCYAVDKPIAGLIRDFKARGLFDDTLLIWSGEFGRTPYFEDLSDGKDRPEDYGRGHNPDGFCAWMAGGGVRGGLVYEPACASQAGSISNNLLGPCR